MWRSTASRSSRGLGRHHYSTSNNRRANMAFDGPEGQIGGNGNRDHKRRHYVARLSARRVGIAVAVHKCERCAWRGTTSQHGAVPILSLDSRADSAQRSHPPAPRRLCLPRENVRSGGAGKRTWNLTRDLRWLAPGGAGFPGTPHHGCCRIQLNGSRRDLRTGSHTAVRTHNGLDVPWGRHVPDRSVHLCHDQSGV